ncbi:HEAT repeat-containing protein 4-like [Styela clava]
MPRRLEAPVFFTSAAKVKIPFVGDDTRAVKFAETQFYPISNPLEKHHNEVSKHFVRLVSNDVRFNDDVILERCSHSLPFKSHDFSDLYSPDFVSTKSKPERERRKEYPGRFDSRGYNRKMPGHLKKLHEPSVLKKSSVEQIHDLYETQSSSFRKKPHFPRETDAFTELIKRQIADELKLADKPYMSSSTGISPNDWDEVILENLSKDTAHWIVYEALPTGLQKIKLGRFLQDKYGEKMSNTHIVRAEVSESDLKKLKKSKKEEMKKEHDLKRMESNERHRQEIRSDKLFKKSIAEYYKLPRFLTQQHSKVITTSNEVNSTARNIKVKHLVHSPPPKMEDFLNKAAGKYIKATDNEFEQQLYTGQAKPVHQKFGDRSRVVMDDLSEYKVDVCPKYPLNPNSWVQKRKPTESENKYTKGLQRWMKLPQPADFMSERGLNPPKSEEAQIEQINYNKLDSMVNNLPLITLVEEWRSKWKLVGQWQDIPLSEILIDMDSLHDHIRLGSVAACAMASLHKKPINDITSLAVTVMPTNDLAMQSDDENTDGHLPEVLIKKVEGKLKDSNKRVCLAAAICLYSLNSTDDTVFNILKNNVKHGYSSDRLAAAQCLALSNDISSEVIRMMIQLLLEKNNTSSSKLTIGQREQATMLLIHISNNTSLVHSLLAEQLNSSSWKDRVVACQVLAKLTGNINKDLVRKLTNLMWHDWSTEVRKAAAETLGRTGHGRDIHFELRNKLAQGNEVMRVNVLKKISHLGIMTAALLPAFMQCFADQYVSVRMQACKTAGKLQLNDESIAAELLRLMEFDPSWRIKAHAIKAIRETGFSTDKIHDALVWALRFEDESGVRMEACLALRMFYQNQIPGKEVLHIIQDRALVEPDPAVKEEVQKTLEAFDTTSYGDNLDMIQQIKTEVRRLCNKGVIAAKITMYERELNKYQNKVQYMGLDQDSLDDFHSTTEDSDNQSVALGTFVNDNRPEIIVTPSTGHRSPKSRSETRQESTPVKVDLK